MNAERRPMIGDPVEPIDLTAARERMRADCRCGHRYHALPCVVCEAYGRACPVYREPVVRRRRSLQELKREDPAAYERTLRALERRRDGDPLAASLADRRRHIDAGNERREQG